MANPNQIENNIEKEIKSGEIEKGKKGFKARFEKIAAAVTKATGSSTAFLIAVAVILIWACTGPIFHYSDTWQLVINTGTPSSLS